MPQWKRISALACPPAQTSIWSIIAKRQSLSSGGEIKYTAARDFGASRHFGAKLPQSLLNVQTPTLHSGHRSEERRVGKDVSVRVDLGGRRIIKKKKHINIIQCTTNVTENNLTCTTSKP